MKQPPRRNWVMAAGSGMIYGTVTLGMAGLLGTVRTGSHSAMKQILL
jgi:hypothetical protein